MIVREGFSLPEPNRRIRATIGFFDGVHRGHQAIMHHICQAAKRDQATSCVVTFDRHPTEFLTGARVPLLTTWEEKVCLLEKLGVDMVRVLPFGSSLASLGPYEFLERLSHIGQIKEIAIGSGFAFGRGRGGDAQFLARQAKVFGYHLTVVPHILEHGEKVSSSKLRNLLKAGRIHEVKSALGHHPTVRGRVVRGRGVGHGLGFPTVNLACKAEKLLPATGAYAGYFLRGDSCSVVMMNIGSRPTFEDGEEHVEAHILDYTADLYHQDVTVCLVERLRSIKKFADAEKLSQQLGRDARRARAVVQIELGHDPG